MSIASLGLLAAIAGLPQGWQCRTPEIITKLKSVPRREFAPLPPDSPLRKPLLAGRKTRTSRAKRKAAK